MVVYPALYITVEAAIWFAISDIIPIRICLVTVREDIAGTVARRQGAPGARYPANRPQVDML
jgi:hypothetical protein